MNDVRRVHNIHLPSRIYPRSRVKENLGSRFVFAKRRGERKDAQWQMHQSNDSLKERSNTASNIAPKSVMADEVQYAH
jgi:hypothetical protein